MKLLIAALISAALFLTLPQHQGKTPINNSTKRVQVTQAVQVATTEKVAEVQPSAQTEQQAVDSSEEVQAPVAIPEPVQPLTDKQSLMQQAGIDPSEWEATDYIVSHESSWNPSATNASSGAYGLCQALPASKMASAGEDYVTNPVTQLKWCHQYANSRYGSWWASFAFWQTNRWW